MLGSEPVIGYESIGPCAGSNVTHKVPVGLGRSPIEPAAMQVKHRSFFLGVCVPRPPAGNSSDRVGLKGDAARGRDVFNDGVERAAAATPSSLPFMPATMLRRAVIAAESSGLSGWIVVQVSEVATFVRLVADIFVLL